MEYNENETDKINEDSSENEDYQGGSAKQWFRDNLRIIVSILIVVVIAGGIYSYSKRDASEQLAQESTEQSSSSENTQKDQPSQTDVKENKEASKDVPVKNEEKKEEVKKEEVKKEDKTSSVASSQETEKSFVETAAKGDGTTHLARRALANYLEKNPDSSLKAEHKIYIEDYLRKNAQKKGRLSVGTSVEFEKSLIADAIAKSKNLNDSQIKNLHKYAVRVPSLS